eukprot:TRINITY_DN10078_c0_g1_i2.p1 TRINITY_DN10078_c0_g1~~TRINITY_DN10078_c0_g1_i2.p1  ORF type:complete len:254 (+),score=40.38 TRINITY_DN10078_c0_g1_i2:43-804(+)
MKRMMTQNSESLQCSMCLELFDDPRTTPYGHNFCCKCLEPSLSNCPLCQSIISKDKPLPINFVLKDICDEVKKQGLACSHQKKCEECDTTAVKYCPDCKFFLCPTHLLEHGNNKWLRNHKPIDVKEAPFVCWKHSKRFRLFCSTCDQPICSICIPLDHREHLIISVSDAVSKKRNEFQTFKKPLLEQENTIQIKITQFQSTITEDEKTIQSLDQQIKSMKTKIQQTREQIQKTEEDKNKSKFKLIPSIALKIN